MEFGIYHLSLIETAMPRSEMTTRCLSSMVNLRKSLVFPTVVGFTPRSDRKWSNPLVMVGLPRA